MQEIENEVLGERKAFSLYFESRTHRKRKGCDTLMSYFFPFMEHPELPNLSFALEREPEDRLVLMALEAILNEKLHYVFLSCSFAYRKEYTRFGR